jgi:predicted Rossmann fold flavoprotein
MRLIYDTIVIGAGASGLFCAKSLTEMKIDTLVIEKMDKPGLKLLITGGGMANITRDEPSYEMLKHYGDKGRFLGSAFSNLPPEDVIKSFRKKGVETFSREDHKVFPVSKQASDILYSLYDGSYPILFNTAVEKIEKSDEYFIINDNYKAKHVVLSTGGITYPLTGSTGDGYQLASNLGHSIVQPKASLTQLKVVSEDLSAIEGISLNNVCVSVPKKKGKKYNELTGDFLFTRFGITGPVVLDISRYCESGMLIKINLNERVEPDRINVKLSNLIKRETSLPSRLIDYILKSEGIEDIEASQTKNVNWQKLNNKLSNWVMEISLKGANKMGMSCVGGVSTKDIDSKTFESKRCENLYFTGEVIDYSGDCGGYNLQACWSTAFSVAKAIKEKENKIEN